MTQEPGPETSVAKISRANWKWKAVRQASACHPVSRKKKFHYLSICVRLEITEAVGLIWLNHWTVLFPERICDGFTRLGVGKKENWNESLFGIRKERWERSPVTGYSEVHRERGALQAEDIPHPWTSSPWAGQSLRSVPTVPLWALQRHHRAGWEFHCHKVKHSSSNNNNREDWDLRGSPGVKNPPAKVRDTGSVSGLGRSHMTQSN